MTPPIVPIQKGSGLTPAAKKALRKPPFPGPSIIRMGRAFARREQRWSRQQWWAFYSIIDSESSWDPLAQNDRTSAFGLAQFLDGTWATVGAVKSADPYLQLEAAAKYIRQRYGGPCTAWSFHIANGWY